MAGPAAPAPTLRDDCDILVFLDGDGSDCPELIPSLVEPIAAGDIRFRDRFAQPRRARARQHGRPPAPGRLADRRRGCGCSTASATPICARSGRSGARRCCGSACAKRHTAGTSKCRCAPRGPGLRILELPVAHRRRAGGASKVSGNLRGTIKASWRILLTFMRIAFQSRRAMQAVNTGAEVIR